MEKIIPFKKDIIFKTNLSEITSISLEHNLTKKGINEISGNFIISGEYKIADTSVDVEKFSYELPFNINMDEKYILDNIEIDIDDFYYEIINDTVLAVNIDVLVKNLEEREIPEELELVRTDNILEEFNDMKEQIVDNNEKPRCIEEEENPVYIEKEKIGSTLFENIDSIEETYKSYKVYIVRDGDNLESILEKYNTTKEKLDEYNDLTEIKLGDKIIIPS